MKRCSNDFVDDRTVLKPHRRRSNDARTTLISPGTVHPGFGKGQSDIDCFWNNSRPALIHFNRFYPVFGAGKGSIFNYSLGVVNNKQLVTSSGLSKNDLAPQKETYSANQDASIPINKIPQDDIWRGDTFRNMTFIAIKTRLKDPKLLVAVKIGSFWVVWAQKRKKLILSSFRDESKLLRDLILRFWEASVLFRWNRL